MQNLNSKKFIVIVAAMVLLTTACLFDKITGDKLSILIQWLIPAYLASDVVAGGIDKMGK